MLTFSVIGGALVTATLIAAVVRSKRTATAGRVAHRNNRVVGGDPYAGQRKPDKLNPGLGGFGAGGGG